MRGMIAPRAEDATANAPACTATRPKITGMLFSPIRVCTSSAIVTSHVPIDDQKYNRPRSTASAIAPPYRPNTTRGSRPTNPTSPTSSEECEIVYTSTGTATWVTIEPMNAVPWPTNSRR